VVIQISRVWVRRLLSRAPVESEMLAPVRNDRETAGKTTAVSAGLVVSRHRDFVVADAGAVRCREPGAS
jgi:hypothetical protein